MCNIAYQWSPGHLRALLEWRSQRPCFRPNPEATKAMSFIPLKLAVRCLAQGTIKSEEESVEPPDSLVRPMRSTAHAYTRGQRKTASPESLSTSDRTKSPGRLRRGNISVSQTVRGFWCCHARTRFSTRKTGIRDGCARSAHLKVTGRTKKECVVST